jgi:coproporphyrinogen III oxidase-like Fe-S oxidoreductase
MNSDTHLAGGGQSTGRQSQRSNNNTDADKKKEQILKAKEFSLMVKDQLKPKVDPKNKVEMELRRHSVSLNQLELQTRLNPIKKVQLTDLL